MKLYVYAICRDEAKFAARWMASMAEADGVYVLDTGSQDGTPELLEQLGAHVCRQQISPWRFDQARNLSLELTPEDGDLYICTDLDEVFDPGWRQALEQAALEQKCRQYRYRYVWSHQPDGSDGMVFWHDKIHTRQGFRWKYPVHEVLAWQQADPCPLGLAQGVCLHHWPDPEKPRSQYLPLLELAVRENPQDPRCAHYLGREYLYARQWEKAAAQLERHLSLPGSRWPPERAASMRYLAQCCQALGQDRRALQWLYRAVAEAPDLREPYVDCARYFYRRQNWPGVLLMCESALAIGQRNRQYLNEAFAWGALPWDLAALAAWNLGTFHRALDYGEQALALDPQNQRLQQNLAFYRGSAALGTPEDPEGEPPADVG